jgi:hypothetical protein
MAVAALIAIFAVAYKSSERFRLGVNNITNAVIGFAEGAVRFAVDNINLFIKAINLVIGAANFFGANLSKINEISHVTFKRLSEVSTATKDIGVEATDTAGVVSGSYVPAFDDLGLAADGATKATDKATAATKKLNDAMKKTLEAAKDTAQAVVDNLEKALDGATAKLDEAKDAFNSFKDTIKGAITGILNFGKAVETGDFLSGLTAQAADATLFAEKVRKLIELGLSERALRQVLDAGFEAGTTIADNIIAGGSTMVNQVNTLVDSVTQVADQVGQAGAQVFFGAGVTQGEMLVAGIRAALDQAQAELSARISALTAFGNVVAAAVPAAKAALKAPQVFPKITYTGKNLPVPKGGVMGFKANGGVVGAGNPYMVGERGPELFMPNRGGTIVPNNRLGSGATYNVTVNAGIGSDGAAIGRVIVDAIKKFERTSGPVFASA